MEEIVEHVSLDRVSVPVLLVIALISSGVMYAASSFSNDIESNQHQIQELRLQAEKNKAEHQSNLKSVSSDLKVIAEALKDMAAINKEAAEERRDNKERIQRLEYITDKP